MPALDPSVSNAATDTFSSTGNAPDVAASDASDDEFSGSYYDPNSSDEYLDAFEYFTATGGADAPTAPEAAAVQFVDTYQLDYIEEKICTTVVFYNSMIKGYPML